MKNKRVGTISMAIVLIGFGVLLFIAQINQLSAVELAIKLWPMILILLGAEVLWYNFQAKEEEDVKIRYDIFSIFIVMTILAVNIGIYGLIQFGLMDVLKDEISTTTFNYDIPLKEYEIDNNIEKIIINGVGYSNIKIRTSEQNKITASGSINIRESRDEKNEKILNEDIIDLSQSGNILYVKAKNMKNIESHIGELNLIIPENKRVEIVGGNDINITMDNVKNNVLIDSVHGINLTVGKNSNAKIETTTNYEQGYEQGLNGNVKWNITKTGNENNPKYKGELIYGDGSNSINIINSYNITVNEI